MLPSYVKSVLWSYDTDKIDPVKHRRLIISQVLNFGTKEATDWLFKFYELNEIRKEAGKIPEKQWNKKSLALWKLALNFSFKERLS